MSADVFWLLAVTFLAFGAWLLLYAGVCEFQTTLEALRDPFHPRSARHRPSGAQVHFGAPEGRP